MFIKYMQREYLFLLGNCVIAAVFFMVGETLTTIIGVLFLVEGFGYLLWKKWKEKKKE